MQMVAEQKAENVPCVRQYKECLNGEKIEVINGDF